jgi:hypothetical protein
MKISGMVKSLGVGMAFAMTSHFADAAVIQPEDRALSVQAALHTLCMPERKALVVDVFAVPDKTASDYERESPVMDIDGDGIPDVSHGDLVAAAMAATGKDYVAYNIPERLPLVQTVEVFEDVIAKIESGAIAKPSHINYSSGFFLTFEYLNTINPALQVTPENAGLKRDAILQTLTRQGAYRTVMAPLERLFRTLDAMGIKIVTGSGNDFSADMFNVLSVLPGTFTGGALDRDGVRSAPYSNTNTLNDFERYGEIFTRSVPGGIDIDGDGAPDFTPPALSGGDRIALLYEGKRPEEIVKKIPPILEAHKKFPDLLEYYLQKSPPEDGIYRAEDIYELLYKYPLTENYKRDIANYGDYVHYPSLLPFRTGADGTLRYDPAGNGDRTIVTDYKGTSYAPPRVCGP